MIMRSDVVLRRMSRVGPWSQTPQKTLAAQCLSAVLCTCAPHQCLSAVLCTCAPQLTIFLIVMMRACFASSNPMSVRERRDGRRCLDERSRGRGGGVFHPLQWKVPRDRGDARAAAERGGERRGGRRPRGALAGRGAWPGGRGGRLEGDDLPDLPLDVATAFRRGTTPHQTTVTFGVT